MCTGIVLGVSACTAGSPKTSTGETDARTVSRTDAMNSCAGVEECQVGAIRCTSDSTFERCESVAGCGKWGEPGECLALTTCAEDQIACTQGCNMECDYGELECVDDGHYRMCERSPSGCRYWTDVTPCDGPYAMCTEDIFTCVACSKLSPPNFECGGNTNRACNSEVCPPYDPETGEGACPEGFQNCNLDLEDGCECDGSCQMVAANVYICV